jgi:phosphate transport system substrate-binding protein
MSVLEGDIMIHAQRTIMWNSLIPIVGMLLLIAVTVSHPSARGWAAESPARRIVIAGSGTAQPSVRPLAEAFSRLHPSIRIDIPYSLGSAGGIRAAAEGAIALGLASRPLKEEEKTWGLTVLPYAQTIVVIATHSSVPDDGITFEDLVRIYKGEKTQWKDGREIIVLTREPGNSSLMVLDEDIPGFKAAYAESQRAERWTTLHTYEEMLRVLAKTRYAVGLADMGVITSQRLPIKPLKVNGVFPTPQNVQQGRYPLVKTMRFVFKTEKLPDGAKAFMDFVWSRQGKKILTANGYLPVE